MRERQFEALVTWIDRHFARMQMIAEETERKRYAQRQRRQQKKVAR
jgi:hypothetical protein